MYNTNELVQSKKQLEGAQITFNQITTADALDTLVYRSRVFVILFDLHTVP